MEFPCPPTLDPSVAAATEPRQRGKDCNIVGERAAGEKRAQSSAPWASTPDPTLAHTPFVM